MRTYHTTSFINKPQDAEKLRQDLGGNDMTQKVNHVTNTDVDSTMNNIPRYESTTARIYDSNGSGIKLVYDGCVHPGSKNPGITYSTTVGLSTEIIDS